MEGLAGLFVIYAAFCFGVVGYRYQGVGGFLAGFFLGPLGALACWASAVTDTETCPDCGTKHAPRVRVCPACHRVNWEEKRPSRAG